MPASNLFISYKRGVHTTPGVVRFYNRIRVQLSGDGIEPFFDRKSIEAGDVWEEKIDACIAAANYFVALISIDFWLSPQCMRELKMAIERYEREGAPRLLFVLADRLSPDDLKFDADWAARHYQPADATLAQRGINKVTAIGQFNFLGPYDTAGMLTSLQLTDESKLDEQLAQLVAAIKDL
ncbi:toll/interleukin-1 receptor domain-containing protein [Massilia sp. S19_KUP03_FR1]|uniref:toll/interleukin-1 receptor domain-containing protein n=1 Tax=Massilia sp. S19_KUP03_FR1 TaxID=3025503 RepID=UPI002FCDD9D2